MQYQRNQRIVLATTAMVPGGTALAKLPDGRPVFVKDGAPDEEAEVRLTRIKRDFAQAEFIQALRPSAARVEAPFPLEALAGANWHHLAYETQLEAKQTILKETLIKIGHYPEKLLQSGLIHPIVGAPATNYWRYRNKIELTFGLDEHSKVALGFHKPGRFDEIVPTDDVALFPAVIKLMIQTVRAWANQEGLSVYEPRFKRGLLRNLVVRRTEQTADLMVNIVTTAQAMPVETLKQALGHLPLTGLVWSKNSSLATIVRIDDMALLSGMSTLTENFLGLPITYGFDSFFQTHTMMAERLAETLLSRLLFTSEEVSLPRRQTGLHLGGGKKLTVIDGYAGVGGFGLFAALAGANVISIESHPASSVDARRNAEHLGVTDRITFINLAMEEFLLSPDSRFKIRDSVLIVDPLRAGLHPKAVKAIVGSEIRHIFYVSCNPATLARDLALLAESYQPIFIQPFDLFPQTSHLETLVEMEKYNDFNT